MWHDLDYERGKPDVGIRVEIQILRPTCFRVWPFACGRIKWSHRTYFVIATPLFAVWL